MAESHNTIEVTQENFATVVVEGSRTRPVLIDFWAEWCQPCKVLLPLLSSLAEAYQGKFLLAKINTEEQQELAAQFGIRSIPTVKLFKDGQPVDEFMGALPEAEIRAFLDKHIPNETDQLLAQANHLIQRGEVEEAIRLVQGAKEADPENPRTLVAYARLKAAIGEIGEARAALEMLPETVQEHPDVIGLRAQLMFDAVAEAAPPTAELQGILSSDPGNSEARYQLAAQLVMEGEYEQALEQLLLLLQKDRAYGDDRARKGMLAIFDIFGGSGELVNRFRNRMFNALH
jgi:putative thioredoxin